MNETRFRGPAYETARLKVARLRLEGAGARDEGFQTLAEIALDTLAASAVRVFLCLRDGEFECRLSVGSSTDLKPPSSQASPFLRELMRTCRVAAVEEVRRELGDDPFGREFLLSRGVFSVLCAPILREGAIAGLIVVEYQTPAAWQATELSFVASLSDLAALLLAQVEKIELEAALAARTEMRRESEKLEALTRMARVVGHDINGLLTVLAAVAQELPDCSHDELVQRGIELSQLVDVCTNLTEQLLTLGGALAPKSEQLDLISCLNEVYALLRASCRYDQELLFDFGPHRAAQVQIDKVSLQRIVMNLVNNALEALGGAGRVVIRVRGPESEDPIAVGAWIVEVEDNGRGMDHATQARAVEPYFTTKAIAKGHGLGLSSVLGLAQRYGGGVRISSSLGKGTRVAVALRRGQ